MRVSTLTPARSLAGAELCRRSANLCAASSVGPSA
jgi:hypothetical protein